MSDWIESGNAITLVIAIVAAEMLFLRLWMKGRSSPILLGLIPGLCLMLALRAAVLDQGALWIALWITASLPAHIVDLMGRIKTAQIKKARRL